MMKKKKINNLTSFDELLDKKYGKRGATKREQWEEEFESFKIGAILEQARKKRNITQDELAARCGTNKSYISRLENNASDVRLSTLMRIIKDGFGGHLRINLEI